MYLFQFHFSQLMQFSLNQNKFHIYRKPQRDRHKLMYVDKTSADQKIIQWKRESTAQRWIEIPAPLPTGLVFVETRSPASVPTVLCLTFDPVPLTSQNFFNRSIRLRRFAEALQTLQLWEKVSMFWKQALVDTTCFTIVLCSWLLLWVDNWSR